MKRSRVDSQKHPRIQANRKLLLTGSEDAPGLAWMASAAHQAWAERGHHLPGVALRLAGEEWVPYLPCSGHPSREEFRLLQLESASRGYAEQAEVLPLHEKVGRRFFIATHSVMPDRDTGEARSYCVWPYGVPTALPLTDQVCFVRDLGEGEFEILGMASWEQVEQEFGTLMERLDVYPERYLVQEFPPEDRLAAIIS